MRSPVSPFVNVTSTLLDPVVARLEWTLVLHGLRTGMAPWGGSPWAGIATLRVAPLVRLRAALGAFLSVAGT
jgi:hypothetical protein